MSPSGAICAQGAEAANRCILQGLRSETLSTRFHVTGDPSVDDFVLGSLYARVDGCRTYPGGKKGCPVFLRGGCLLASF